MCCVYVCLWFCLSCLIVFVVVSSCVRWFCASVIYLLFVLFWCVCVCVCVRVSCFCVFVCFVCVLFVFYVFAFVFGVLRLGALGLRFCV